MTQRRGDRRTDGTEVHHVHQEPTFDETCHQGGLIGAVATRPNGLEVFQIESATPK